MARASAKTATASGAKTVSVAADIPADLFELLAQFSTHCEPQPGEYTRRQLLERAGSEYKLVRFLNDNAARITKRRMGQTMLYRLK